MTEALTQRRELEATIADHELGHSLVVKDFGAFEAESDLTVRRGFLIKNLADQGRSYAECFEGYALDAISPDGKELIEPDVLEIHMVKVSGEGGKGLGTDLMRQAVVEGRDRGFHIARLSVENPRVMRMLQRLQGEGLIKDARYIRNPQVDYQVTRVLSTEEIAQSSSLTPQAAEAYLSSLPSGDEGMVDAANADRVEAVVWL